MAVRVNVNGAGQFYVPDGTPSSQIPDYTSAYKNAMGSYLEFYKQLGDPNTARQAISDLSQLELPELGGSQYNNDPVSVDSDLSLSTGLGLFSSAVNSLSSLSSPLGAAFSAVSGYSDYKDGVERDQAFAAAEEPGATVSDKLRASQQQPGFTDTVVSALGFGLAAATGNVVGAVASAADLVGAQQQSQRADAALASAAASEHAAAAAGTITGAGFGSAKDTSHPSVTGQQGSRDTGCFRFRRYLRTHRSRRLR